MKSYTIAALGLLSLVSGVACADASYEQTSQITGGTLTDTIRSIGFLSKASKEMLAPTNSLTMVHGNQKAVVNKNSTEIIDLDKETITHIDTEKKTYTVMTFAQMRQAAADMMKRIQQAPPQQVAAGQQPKSTLKTSFEVTVKNTGQSKSVNGLDAQEQVVEMRMHVTDPNGAGTEAQNTFTYTVTTDAWIAPDPPEVKEIQDFDARMGKKMMEGADLSAFKPGGSNAGLAQMFGSKPGTAEAMAQMQKEMAKLKGTRIMEVTRMGGDAPATATATATGQQQSAGSGSSVVGDASQAAGSAATSSAAGAAGYTAGSAAANAAGNSIGGSVLGSAASAFSSKLVSGMFQKKPAAATSPANTTTTTVAGTQPTTRVVLMEMTMQKSNFSQEAVPPSAFAVPDGFKQMPSPYDQMSK